MVVEVDSLLARAEGRSLTDAELAILAHLDGRLRELRALLVFAAADDEAAAVRELFAVVDSGRRN
jgi:hypothetical protein